MENCISKQDSGLKLETLWKLQLLHSAVIKGPEQDESVIHTYFKAFLLFLFLFC